MSTTATGPRSNLNVEVTLHFWPTPQRRYRDGGWTVGAAPPPVTQVRFQCLLSRADWGKRQYLVDLAEALDPVPGILPRAVAAALKDALAAVGLVVAVILPGVVVLEPPTEP